LILLDTNVIVYYLKGDPSIVVRVHNASRGELAIPAIVVYELEY
jgi:predicted nucleic acid-binding protein